MSEQEVNHLLGLFQRLAGDMENYAYFYAKSEEGKMLKVEGKKLKDESNKSETKADGRMEEPAEEEMEAWREMHDVPSPDHVPFWKVLEENGVDYDSDQSRGV